MLHRRARFVAAVIRNIVATETFSLSRPATIGTSIAPSSNNIVRKRTEFERHRIVKRPFSSASALPNHAPLPSSHLHYTITICTGSVRGAGTSAHIRLQLIGTTGKSDFVVISRNSGFGAGTVVKHDISMETDIGDVRMVLVERGEGDGSGADSWFLDKLLIEDENGDSLTFLCMQWFGLSECGAVIAPTYRYLLPQSTRTTERQHVGANPIKIRASGMVIPHPDKVRDDRIRAINKNGRGLGGEDAYFAVHGKNEIFGMGVADGVYAWRKEGIDPGRFAYYLMEQAYLNIRAGYDDVFRVLKTASRKMEAEGVYGSSTCCLLTINMKNGRLNSVLLGDSGFIVAGRRDYQPELKLIFHSPQQEHEFGRPFQLGHHIHANKPTDAMMESFQVFPGDTIVMGTDGLFDNLFLPTILQQIDTHRASGRSPQALAGHLIELAYRVSLDKAADTPYTRAYTEALNLTNSGGKPDDISVIVAYVSHE